MWKRHGGAPWKHEGWLGEHKDSGEPVDDMDVLDLHDMARGWQFREAQGEDAELQGLRSTALDTPPAVTLGTTPWFEVRNQLLYIEFNLVGWGSPKGHSL